MSFTSSDVRRELGDPSTDTLTDSTLQAVINEENSLESAAAHSAKILSRKFALKADKSMGDVSLEYQARSERWQDLSESLSEDAVEAVSLAGDLSSDYYFSTDMFTENWLGD